MAGLDMQSYVHKFGLLVLLTCWFGSREHKSCSTATVDFVVTSVDVDAVHSEGLQVGNLHELCMDFAFGERILFLQQLWVSDVALQSCDVPACTLEECAIGHSEQVSTLPVWRSETWNKSVKEEERRGINRRNEI